MIPHPPPARSAAKASRKMRHTPNGRVISLAQKSGLRKRELVLQAVVEAERREDDEAISFDRSLPMTFYELRKTLEENHASNAFSRGFEARSYAKFEQAAKEYLQGFKRNPKDFKCLFNLGFVYAKQGDFRAAQLRFEQACALRKDIAFAPFNCGVCKFFLGDFKGAVKSFDKAILLGPGIQSFYLARALAYRRIGEYRNATVAVACEDYLRAKKLKARETLVHFDSRTAFSKDPLFDSTRLRDSLHLAKGAEDGNLLAQLCEKSLSKSANQRTAEDVDSLAKLLAAVSCFKNLDKEFIRQLTGLLKLQVSKKSDILCYEEEMGVKFYYILRGVLDVFVVSEGTPNAANIGERVNQLRGGNHFGDSTLFKSRKRTATVKVSSTECALMVISQADFQGIYKEYLTAKQETKVKLFKQVSLLHGLTDEELIQIAKSFKEVKYHYGSRLYKQSSKLAGIYIVHQGMFKIVRTVRHGKSEEEVTIGTLATTDCFGHQTALNKDRPAPEVSVICEHSASVFVLSKKDLFDSTTFSIRTRMRRNLAMVSNDFTSIKKEDVRKRLLELKKWQEYKSHLVQSIARSK